MKTIKDNESEEYLTAIDRFLNKTITLGEIADFLCVSVDEFREAIETNLSLDNGILNISFKMLKKDDPLYKSVVEVTDVEIL